MHPFRRAITEGYATEQFKALFADNIEFWAPMLTKPVYGKDLAMALLTSATEIVGKIDHTAEIRDLHQTLLFWNGHVDGYLLEAVTICVDDEQGLIKQVRVLMRSWPYVTLFQQAMHHRLAAVIPADYWELQPLGCMVPVDSGVALGAAFKALLWEKYHMAAPAQRRQLGYLSSKVQKAYKS